MRSMVEGVLRLALPPLRRASRATSPSRGGLIAGATSIAALNGELAAETSLVGLTWSTSTRPMREKPATMPGVTQRPCASTMVAPAGTATPRPAATTRPFVMTTVPPSIGGVPSPTTTRPPVIAID